MRFRERVVMVTGGGHGIGAAIARAFAGEGARVAVLEVDAAGLSAAAALAQAHADVAGAVLFLASDATRHITGAVLDVNGGQVMV